MRSSNVWVLIQESMVNQWLIVFPTFYTPYVDFLGLIHYQMITIIPRRRMRKSPSIMVLILVYENQVTNIGKRFFLVSIYLSQYHNSSFLCSLSSLPDTFRYHRTLEILFLVKTWWLTTFRSWFLNPLEKMKNRIWYIFTYIYIYMYMYMW